MNRKTKLLPEYSALCQQCKAGIMHLEYITYFTWLDDDLITVPNFPAWVCDMCGRREYDARAISWLNTLLSPEAGRRYSPDRRRVRSSRIDRAQPRSVPDEY
jgi:YgiT-type zinc finger domain-containing protein